MKNTSCRRLLIATALFAVCLVASDLHATIVFKDNFDRADSSTIGSASGPGTGTWTELITQLEAVQPTVGDVLISGNQVLVDHGETNSRYEVGVSTSGFLSPWASTLAGNPGKVTWNFNLQSARDNLSGFASGSNGMGMVLASTAGAYGTTNGYAVVLGNTGSTDPILFVSFTGATSVPIIVGSGVPFGDLGTNYLSMRVEYEPSTNTWTMYGRNDGVSAFADPETGAGYVNLGSVVNSDHTSATMAQMGMFGFFTSNGAGDLYRYDNISIDVVPEPSSVVLAGAAVAGMLFVACRRRNAV
jgi:trimeric autotransporter adhesin